ncbi:hypothetical protein [Vibrio cholerae]|uniref:hypothetical protein n=1 Tax=Vibrio cholerae TaxID=666 RepID=UPI000757212C|nr:hypothetical protein [Vibrio cholerae]EII3728484.1 hypothetical protein [Vibrio cholerae]PNM36628.1 hypothetical protein AL466_005740 [Vibrio cholerae]HDL9461393.1 hypothetical protein [Vibrio cholerae]
MIVSNQAKLIDRKQLAKHQRKHPANYELVLESNGELVRYYQDEFTYAKAEAIKAVLQRQGDIQSPFVYLEKLESETWYACSFDNEGVHAEAVADLETLLHDLSYDIHIASKILIANGELNFHKDKQYPINAISQDDLKPFALKQVKKSIKSFTLPVVLALIVAISSVWFFSENETQTVAVAEKPKTEKELFLEGFDTNVLASDVIDNALNIFIEAKLAPAPIEIDKIDLDGDRLISTLKLNDVRQKVIRDWLESNEGFKNHYNLSNNQLSVSLSHVSEFNPAFISRYKSDLIDALEWLGAKVTKKSESLFDDISVVYFEMEMDAHLGNVRILSGVLNTPLVTMKSFSMTKQDSENVKLVMSFNLQGLVNEL